MTTVEEQLALDESQISSLNAHEDQLELEVITLQAQIESLNAQIQIAENNVIDDQREIQQLREQRQPLEDEVALLNERLAMLNTMQIPSTSGPYGIKKGDQGLRVWALQRALNELGFGLVEDGVFGETTEIKVKNWQENAGLDADGIFGMASSDKMAAQFDTSVATQVNVPKGLVRGQIEAESGDWIAAVNTSVPGGIDCGYTQRRVYSSDYSNQDVIRRAWDSGYQIALLANRLAGRHAIYIDRPAVETSEFAWRLAALYHNWEYGADVLSKTRMADLSSYWTTVKPADQWPTNVGARFPGGELVDTPLKWAKFYALGAPNRNWPGATTKYVKEWI